jgi:hypothetical protein
MHIFVSYYANSLVKIFVDIADKFVGLVPR